jgi:hypothetical protein
VNEGEYGDHLVCIDENRRMKPAEIALRREEGRRGKTMEGGKSK